MNECTESLVADTHCLKSAGQRHGGEANEILIHLGALECVHTGEEMT